MIKQWILLLGLQCFLFYCNGQSNVVLTSPDSKTHIKIFIDNGQLSYNVQYNNENICSAQYGFQLGRDQYGSNVASIEASNPKLVKRTFDIRGNTNTVTTVKNVYQLNIQSKIAEQNFKVWVNVYNNGIALSYEVAHHGKILEKALSNIKFPTKATYWYQDDVVDYEANYFQSTKDKIKDQEKIGMPLTLTLPSGIFAAAMEANLENFAGTHFVNDKKNDRLDQVLAGTVTPSNNPILKSPWFILAFSKDLNGLVNNNLVDDVSDSPDKKIYPQRFTTSWIKPGMALWSWMANDRTVSPDNMKRFTDYAAQLHIPYNLIDEGWSYWKADGKDCWDLLKEQVDYAKNKGVGIWVWKAYPDRGHVTGLKDSTVLNEFMSKCSEIGVKGLKIDFFDSEKQPEIEFYSRAAKLAAKYHLMIDYHGANKATGLEHTYPNVLTQEGVRGLEQEYNVNWPFHNTVLPFTRYLSGPADFTPMSFRPFVYSTTLAHQAATVAIYTSPFLCLGVDPADLLKSPALKFIQNMPSTWDETVVLKESKLGEVAVFARRKGEKWYLAVTNGETPKSLTMDLSFLGKNGSYKLDAMSNDLQTRNTQYPSEKVVNSNSHVKIDLPYGGGYLGIFSK